SFLTIFLAGRANLSPRDFATWKRRP
ncbi:MAG: hypothetical protein RI910_1418, partial [Verrucomicrobiota bacterium]